MNKKPSTPKITNMLPENGERRTFVKTVAAGITSVTLTEPVVAAGEEGLPAIVSLLLDDELPIGIPIRFDPSSDNQAKTITVPKNATTMTLDAYGAGGAGATGNSSNQFGGDGGAGGRVKGQFNVSDLSNTELTLEIGEGATAGEAFEASIGGASGGGDGGITAYNGSGNPSTLLPTFGGGGGGRSIVYSGEQVLAVGGGGGGGGGTGRASESSPGAGGPAQSQTNESRVGEDANGSYPGQGGQFSEGGMGGGGNISYSGEDADNTTGGTGGNSFSESAYNAGGAGGGGGAGYSRYTETGGGGGGGASLANEDPGGGSGGGGAGGANYLASYAYNEPSDFYTGSAGGNAGQHLGVAAESGTDGYIIVEFGDEEIAPTTPQLSYEGTTVRSQTFMSIRASVTDGGGSPVFERGVVYSTEQTPQPDEFDSVAIASEAGAGDFSVDLTGLDPDTRYYFRPFARNDTGIGYTGATIFSDTTAYIPPSVSTYAATSIGDNSAQLNGEIVDAGDTPITQYGFDLSTSSDMSGSASLLFGAGSAGPYSHTDNSLNAGTTYYYRAFARNEGGTTFGSIEMFSTSICLAEGTLCRLADGSQKPIEDLTHTDELLVWDFDIGKFATAKPAWIKVTQRTGRVNLLEFDDGTTLYTIGDHRIFNQQTGQFTPAMSDATPLGTQTFNDKGEAITLVGKSVVERNLNYYNVITEKHLNLFANGVLTSCRLNNLYPIHNMVFVKEDRVAKTFAQFNGVPLRLFTGLRLAEQPASVEQLQAYVERLIQYEKLVQQESNVHFEFSGIASAKRFGHPS